MIEKKIKKVPSKKVVKKDYHYFRALCNELYQDMVDYGQLPAFDLINYARRAECDLPYSDEQIHCEAYGFRIGMHILNFLMNKCYLMGAYDTEALE